MKFCRMQFHFIKMSQYFPKPFEPFGGDINVKVDLFHICILPKVLEDNTFFYFYNRI